MQGSAYVSTYWHPTDCAVRIRQAEEAEADSKIQVKRTGINWLRNTSKLGGLELNLLSLIKADPILRKNGNYLNILTKVGNT